MTDWPPTADELREKYWTEGLSQAAIADEYGVTDGAVCGRMDDYGIEARSPGRHTDTSESEVRRLYHEQEMSAIEVAEELGKKPAAIYSFMRDHDIERRSRSEAQKCRESWQCPRYSHEQMHELYVEEELTGPQIADRLGVTPHRVYRILEYHGIERRGRGKATLRESGAENDEREDEEGGSGPDEDTADCDIEYSGRLANEDLVTSLANSGWDAGTLANAFDVPVEHAEAALEEYGVA